MRDGSEGRSEASTAIHMRPLFNVRLNVSKNGIEMRWQSMVMIFFAKVHRCKQVTQDGHLPSHDGGNWPEKSSSTKGP